MGNIQSALTCRTQPGMEFGPKTEQFYVHLEILQDDACKTAFYIQWIQPVSVLADHIYQVMSNLVLFSGISVEATPQSVPGGNKKRFLPTTLPSEREAIIREWDAIIFDSAFSSSRQGENPCNNHL